MDIKAISQHLLEKTCNFRCGIVSPYQKVPYNFCDISNVYNYSIPGDPNENWQSASGALNSNENSAIIGTIAEALERYCSAVCDFKIEKVDGLVNKNIIHHCEFSLFSKVQYADPGFIWKKPDPNDSYFCKVHSLYDNSEAYVPQELIGLGSRHKHITIPSTSTGIAAHTNKYDAILSALMEVLERDALTVYWLNSLGGREISMCKSYTDEVVKKGGKIFCFDITQKWNPFPVVVVCGYLLKRGRKRVSLGAACRPSYTVAIKKAYFEWIQGCIFAGYYDEFHPELKINKNSDVNSFDLHAVYYTKKPELWESTPLIKKRQVFTYNEKIDPKKADSEHSIRILLQALKHQNIRLFYKDLTTIDVRDAGLTVVRVMSPELSLLHGDENMPFLGGKANDVEWRYDQLKSGEFPNPFPHPLG